MNQTIVERSEKQMQDILEDFRTVSPLPSILCIRFVLNLPSRTLQSLVALREADMDTIDHLKNRMVQVVPEL